MTITNPPTEDCAFSPSCPDRLSEKRADAASRCKTASREQAEQMERGLRTLDDPVQGLEQGKTPDRVTIGLLTVVLRPPA